MKPKAGGKYGLIGYSSVMPAQIVPKNTVKKMMVCQKRSARSLIPQT